MYLSFQRTNIPVAKALLTAEDNLLTSVLEVLRLLIKFGYYDSYEDMNDIRGPLTELLGKRVFIESCLIQAYILHCFAHTAVDCKPGTSQSNEAFSMVKKK